MSAPSLVATLRVSIGVVGACLVAFGGWLVLSGGRTTDLVSVLTFVAVPIVVHDAVLAPAVVVAGWWVARFAPPAVRAPLAAALLVAGSLALVAGPLLAVQVLGRRPTDNPSVDPLDYRANLAGLIAVVVVVTAGWAAARAVTAARRRRADAPR